MAASSLTIQGQVFLTPSNQFLPNVRVEIWDSSGPYGWIASANANAVGSFSLVITDNSHASLVELIMNRNIVPEYKIFRNGTLLGTQTTPYTQGQFITVQVNQSSYDAALADNTNSDQQVTYIQVYGKLTDANNNPISGATISIIENGFRTSTTLATVSADINGNYNVKISTKNVINTTVLGQRSLKVQAFNSGALVASSPDIFNWAPIMPVNLVTQMYIPTSEYQTVHDTISTIVGSSNIVTITQDDKSSINEFRYVAGASGNTETAVRDMVNANVYAAQAGVQSDMAYALCKGSTNSSVNPILTMKEQDMRNAISNAMNKSVIAAYQQPQIDTFITAAKAYQVTSTKSTPINGETFTLGTALTPVFGSDANLTNFLNLYNSQDYTDTAVFWSNYTSTYGATMAQTAQNGLQIAGITGLQPQIITSLMGTVGSGNVSQLAAYDESQWLSVISAACRTSGTLCVPAALRNGSTDPNNTAAQQAYASQLTSIVQNMYPLTRMNVQLQGSGGAQIIANQGTRTQAIQFINNNPSFDLRINSIHDISGFNTTGVTDIAGLQAALAPIQRVMRVTGGAPDAVAAMVSAGVSSARDIVSMGAEGFVSAFSSVLGSADAAASAFSRASLGHTIALHGLMDATLNATMPAIPVLPPFVPTPHPQDADPDLVTMFGSLDYCSCDQCMSMYSPAAYLADALNFLYRQAGTATLTPGSALPVPSAAYTELMRRRGDLAYIDLSCKNTNTPIPYIDLVNELLETAILKQLTPAPSFIPTSFQTNGTQEELAAYPEHKYKDTTVNPHVYKDYLYYSQVYDNALSTSVYPNNLPFSLALEETRTYLKYLGISRHDMMMLFQPPSLKNDTVTVATNQITNYALYSEWLGIPQAASDTITAPSASTPWIYYGFKTSSVSGLQDPSNSGATLSGAWDSLLCSRIDVLLHQARISYKELLEFLNTDFVNPNGYVQIAVQAGIPVDTCILKDMYLSFTGTATQDGFLAKLQIGIRLLRTNKLSIYQWDILLRSFNITTINLSAFEQLGQALYLSEKLNIAPERLASWWSNIDTRLYTDYDSSSLDTLPSVYSSIFYSKAVINDPNYSAFSNSAALPSSYAPYTAQIAGFSLVSENDILLLLAFLGISTSSAITLSGLSRIYALAQVAKSTGFSVQDMITVFNLVHNAPYTFTNSLTDLQNLVNSLQAVKDAPFSIMEFDYLVRNVDESGSMTPNSKTIELFYEGLRAELQKLPVYNVSDPNAAYNLNQLSNVIYQGFSKQFGIPVQWVSDIIGSGATGIIGELIAAAFLTSPSVYDVLTETSTLPVSDLYAKYRLIYKIVYISNKLKLSTDEFGYLYANPTVTGFNFSSLYINVDTVTFSLLINTTPSAEYTGLLCLGRWVQVRDQLNLTGDQLISLLNAAFTVIGTNPPLTPADPTYFADLTTCLTNWSKIINQDTWGTMLGDLIGTSVTGTGSTPAPAGLLNVTFPTDFAPNVYNNVSLIFNIVNIVSWCQRTGLNPASLQKVLRADLVLNDSHKILLAAKGKHTDDDWGKVAKPLRDTIREKQRDALLAYLLANPPAGNLNRWQNDNDIYAYLLIDVDMEACMLTSRVKQAISSVQLFIDRIIMNMEFSGGNLSNQISVAADFIKQWKQWRKWYSVWEANREVFMYPENWLEPDIRDDRTTFFKELQTELQQNSATADGVSDAIYNYLTKVDEVARLEPVGICDETDPVTGQLITHVIGRSYGDRKYYYRKLVDDLWTGWEKIEVEIKSDQIMPVMWRGRLHIFWLTFKEKSAPVGPGVGSTSTSTPHNYWFYNNQLETNGDMTKVDTSSSNIQYYKQLEVTLNWTEYKNGHWLKQKVGNDKMLLKLNPFIQDFLADIFTNDTSSARDFYKFLSKEREMTAAELVESRLHLFPYFPSGSDGDLYIWLQFPNDFYDTSGEEAYFLTTFLFSDASGEPDVVRVSSWDWTFPAPAGTVFNNSQFRSNDAAGTNQLKVDSYYSSNVTKYDYFSEWYHTVPARKRSGSSVILNKTPNGSFRVVHKSNFGDNPLENQFIFEDKQNTFFARIVQGPLQLYISPSPSIATAAHLAYQFYVPNAIASGSLTISAPFSSTPSISSSVLFGTPSFISLPLYQNYYYFQTFYHPHIHDFITAFNRGGVDGLLAISNQTQTDTMNFIGNYQPSNILVDRRYPTNVVDFSYNGAYSIYNWELFYHAPMLIAGQLSANQQFEDAQRWYHYIFDPTSNRDANGNFSITAARFWKSWPLYNQAGQPVQSLADLITQINQNNAAAVAQVKVWEDNPFDPYAIARLRILSFMKNTVMKYLDNLIAWGDSLFSQDTIESINEATQLYILAANILGDKPQEIPARLQPVTSSFEDLLTSGTLDTFSNALVAIENYISPLAASYAVSTGQISHVPVDKMPQISYFCLPANDQLLGYWDIIADRLFKIRNCENIQGQVQQLPLFEPPINPALLIRAAAAGVDIATALSESSVSNLPNYRFNYMLQKANELCSDVKALGSALLSALEKKDVEDLAILRSGLEYTVLQSMLQIKQAQLNEANANLDALYASQAVTQAKYDYYSSRQKMTSKEQQYFNSVKTGVILQTVQSALQGTASVLSVIPQFHGQFIGGVGASFGGQHLGSSLQMLSTVMGIIASINTAQGNMANVQAGYERRWDDWQFQAQSAQKELAQISKQIIAAEIRIDIAQSEVDNQQIQIDNNRAVDDFMRNKYTNSDLYNWMITQLSATYFQAYQLAYAYAKKAGLCYDHELPFASQPSSQFITFGYWDSLKKGLLTGEKLQYDLRKLEAAYIDANIRERELTKHISLAMIAPDQLVALRESGSCNITIPNWLFDMDYPGHYMRRIKSVALSIPCVAGPYTTIACELSLGLNTIYAANHTTVESTSFGGIIATSTAQNDSGMFEVNFRDERYLPFEGYGAESTWALTLMDESTLRQFDYNTISDVIIHMRYTAQNDTVKATQVKKNLKTILGVTGAGGSASYGYTTSALLLPRYYNVNREFSTAWFAGFGTTVNTAAGHNVARPVNMVLTADQFPAFCKGRKIQLSKIYIYAVPASPNASPTPQYKVEVLHAGTAIVAAPLNLVSSTSPFYTDVQTFSPTIIIDANDPYEIDLKLYQLISGVESVVNSTDILEMYMVIDYQLSN